MQHSQQGKLLQMSLQLHSQLADAKKMLADMKRKRDDEPGPVQQGEEAVQEGEEAVTATGRKKKRMWVREWLLERPRMGQFHILMDQLLISDEYEFANHTRLTPDLFFWMLSRIRHRIEKQETFWRKPLSPEYRFAMVLRYYATGMSFRAISQEWVCASNTVCNVVHQVSQAIIDELSEEYLKTPTTKEEWIKIANAFATRWNFEHCLGALDGKHVAITKPQNSGSLYYNYKGFFSIILLALVDADYKFIWADVGTNGACSDAQVWNDCELQYAVQDDILEVPEAEPLVEGEQEVPYFLIGDNAFALRTYMMTPFSHKTQKREERIFNYRISRARRIVENAFGILVNRFRVLLTTLKTTPQYSITTVTACMVLHNILRSVQNVAPLQVTPDTEDEDHNVVPGSWRDASTLADGRPPGSRNTSSKDAKSIREYLTSYYNGELGAVHWQDKMVP